MAEFPDLGSHCAEACCKRLDFLPVFCSSCQRNYCSEHGQRHSCVTKPEAQLSKTHSGTGFSEYKCAFVKCLNTLPFAVVCQCCKKNFCLIHRYPETHCCELLKEHISKSENCLTFKELKEKNEASKANKVKKKVGNEQLTKKTLSKEQQAKADRIAVMRFKMKTKDIGVDEANQLFLIVSNGEKREPVLVSKCWSVGKCVDHIVKKTGFYGQSSVGFSLFTEDGRRLLLDDTASKYLSNLNVVYLKN